MKRIAILSLVVVVIVAGGLAAWFFVAPTLSANAEIEACQAVYDELRRQIADPVFAKIDSCEQATIIAGEPGSYMVSAYFVSDGTRYLFVGQAWQSSQGWEATVNPPHVVN